MNCFLENSKLIIQVLKLLKHIATWPISSSFRAPNPFGNWNVYCYLHSPLICITWASETDYRSEICCLQLEYLDYTIILRSDN